MSVVPRVDEVDSYLWYAHSGVSMDSGGASYSLEHPECTLVGGNGDRCTMSRGRAPAFAATMVALNARRLSYLNPDCPGRRCVLAIPRMPKQGVWPWLAGHKVHTLTCSIFVIRG